MYFVELFKKLGKKSNLPILLYLVLNVFLIVAIMQMFWMSGNVPYPFWKSCMDALVLYVFSLMIALSPIGEFILRLQAGCRKIRDKEIKDFIQPIFDEVYQRALETNPELSNRVKLFVCDDESANAFALGRETICITKGLLNLPEHQIKAIIGHEFGHLTHKDTDLILMVYVGNLIVSGIIIFIRVIITIVYLIFSFASMFVGGREGGLLSIVTGLYHLAITLFVAGFTKIWSWVGMLLVMKSSRDSEYIADHYSAQLGYKEGLCEFLMENDNGGTKGLFAALASTHPKNEKRIARLEEI